ncbi:MAG: Asp-tRNA(Asn)/Glu-tRNA(Gln) amidotransferase subunit GatA [Bacteroidetes bacterium]|nr:Asp-tRNA(Asn)/Glu-tRNA(Gln) amidotransferase subunit GatA [Bacteroidota bacterium]
MTYHQDRFAFNDGSTTVREKLDEFLARIEERSALNAFITVDADGARARSAESDERFTTGLMRPLEGMTIAVKDNISVRGMRMTCASKILENFRPVYDATIIERLNNAGAVIIGKTNMDEFAMGSSNETSAFGPVLHPIDPTLVPGGSSGGSAVSVAAGLCHAALGSDTGGSIRQPAAFCGVVGFKPTYGTVSRYGLTAFASSLDQIGTFTRTVEDTAAVFDAICGHDPMDSTSAPRTYPSSIAALTDPLPDPLRIGVLPESDLEGCDHDVILAYRATIERLRALGATINEVTLPHRDVWIPTYFILATAEASSNLARFDGVRYGYRAEATSEDVMVAARTQGFGTEVKRRIMLGTYVLSSGYYDAYYTKAQQARRLISEAYASIFASHHAMLMPTTPTTAFERGAKNNDPVAMWLSDLFTVSANIAGIPAISIPSGSDAKGLPIGMQLQAGMFQDALLLRIAAAVEASFAG